VATSLLKEAKMDTEAYWENKRQEALNDSRTTEELIRIALTEADEHAAWEPVGVLHFSDNREAFEAACRLCVK
jgi:hypothetical protein